MSGEGVIPSWPAAWPGRSGLLEIANDDPRAFRQLYQQQPDPKPRCGCPEIVVQRVLRGGTCGRGGCPYGGDF